MNTFGLTKRQYYTLCVIQELIDETGIAPSYQEITDEMGFKSKSNVAETVRELRHRGYIDFLLHCARSITILQRVPLPEDAELALTPLGEAAANGQAKNREPEARSE